MRRSSERAAALLILTLTLIGCHGADEVDGTDPRENGATAPAVDDFWIERYGAYMTPEFREAYLATPDEERFRVHGAALQDFQRREELLSRAKKPLSDPRVAEYRKLPDLDACREYLRTHAGGVEE